LRSPLAFQEPQSTRGAHVNSQTRDPSLGWRSPNTARSSGTPDRAIRAFILALPDFASHNSTIGEGESSNFFTSDGTGRSPAIRGASALASASERTFLNVARPCQACRLSGVHQSHGMNPPGSERPPLASHVDGMRRPLAGAAGHQPNEVVEGPGSPPGREPNVNLPRACGPTAPRKPRSSRSREPDRRSHRRGTCRRED
jgi:hypothetical protein